MNILSFSSWFWISYFCTTKHWLLATKTGQEVLKCHKIRYFAKYALGPFGRANIFFRDIFISFCSPVKMPGNRAKTKAAVHGIRCFWQWTLIKRIHNIDITQDCIPYNSPNVSVFTPYHLIQFCSPEKMLSIQVKIVLIDNDSRG